MFGGHGLYRGGVFFGIVYRGHLYFYTSDLTRDEYIRAGSEAFRPRPTQNLPAYYEVPVDVLEDHERLCEWAEAAARARGQGES